MMEFPRLDDIVETDLTRRARALAAEAHGAIGQRRKYTNEPYIVHPVSVSLIVSTVTNDPEMIAAALLRDVVEDTLCTHQQIRQDFGARVSKMVFHLTNVSRREDGNRAYRKALDRAHLECAPPDAQTIKLADIIDNTRSITIHDPSFAPIYLREKQLMLKVLTEGHPDLLQLADKIVETQLEYLSWADRPVPKDTNILWVAPKFTG